MNLNLNIFDCDLNPALWFVCGFCRQYFPSFDALKEHKSEKHFEHWTKVRCVVFEEKLYDKLWIPTNENIIYSQLNTRDHLNESVSQSVDVQYSCNCECHSYQNAFFPSVNPEWPESVSVSAPDPNIVMKQEESNEPKKPNPFVLLTRLTSKELNDALQKNSSKLTSERSLRRIKRNRTNRNFPEISEYVPFKRRRKRQNFNTKTKTKLQIISRNASKAQTICIDSDSDSNNSLASFLEPNTLEVEELDDPTTQNLNSEELLPLVEWLILQKERQKEAKNIQEAHIIVELDPDPTSFSKDSNLKSDEQNVSFELSSDNPVTCKLCQMKLETEDGLKNHVENCWLHNKRKHHYCVICNESFYSPSSLIVHNRIIHKERNPAETNQDVDSNEFDLPLVQWLIKEKEDPKNVVLIKPDLTLSNSSIVEVTFPVTCLLCQENLLSDNLLRNHVRTCWRFNKLKHVYCDPCKKFFRDHEKLTQHRRHSRKHPKFLARYLKCEICEQEFAIASQAKCHLESLKAFLNHNFKSSKLTSVKKCDSGAGAGNNAELEELSDWLDLHRQIQWTDGTEKVILIDREPASSGSSHERSEVAESIIKDEENYRWTCRLCLKKLGSVRAVKLHGTRCYQRNKRNHRYCVPCDLGFESPEELQEHRKTEHPSEYGNYFKCKLCRKEFLDETTFKSHEKSHNEPSLLKPFLCPNCPASFTQVAYLSMHQIQHGKVTQFVCKFCTRSFNQKIALESHERTHTGDRPFKCQVENCTMAFISDNSLRTHTTLKHFKELGLPEVLCPTCGRTFGSQSIFNRHARSCIDRPFKCTHEGCTKAYSRKHSLVEHKRCHSGEMPYICEDCGKGYFQKGSFRLHRLTHKGNPFSCPHCARKCPSPWKLTRHITNVHRKIKKEPKPQD